MYIGLTMNAPHSYKTTATTASTSIKFIFNIENCLPFRCYLAFLKKKICGVQEATWEGNGRWGRVGPKWWLYLTYLHFNNDSIVIVPCKMKTSFPQQRNIFIDVIIIYRHSCCNKVHWTEFSLLFCGLGRMHIYYMSEFPQLFVDRYNNNNNFNKPRLW